jgi:hypothetical protein
MFSNLSRNSKNDSAKTDSILFLTSAVTKNLSGLALRIRILLLVRKIKRLAL